LNHEFRTLKFLVRYSTFSVAMLLCGVDAAESVAQSTIHAVPKEHPRLLGYRQDLQKLADQRSEAYKRVVQVARQLDEDDHSKMISTALACAIEQDQQEGLRAVRINPGTRAGGSPCRERQG
jgi:hypothetical protein